MAGVNHKHYLLWMAVAVIATAASVVLLVRQSRSGQGRALYIVGVPEKGAALFFGNKQCSTCHAVNGAGGRVAPDLSGKHPSTPAMGWLTAVLWNHAPGMWRQMRHGNVSYPQLNPEEMAHILAFLYQAGNVDAAGDPNAGQRVFNEKGCVHCHSVRSSGGKTAPELSTVAANGGSGDWTRAMWNHAGAMVDPVTRALGHWPQFAGSEMNDLIAYVSAGASNARERVHPSRGSAERGWQVFQAKCIQCHSVRGHGGAAGPELGPQTDLPLGTAQFAAVLWNHAPSMLRLGRASGIAPPVLQGDEIVDLQMFLASLRYFEPTGSAFVGERVFSERGCAACHGPAAEGTQLAPALRSGAEPFTTVSFTTALWKHGPKMVDSAEESGTRWPILQATDIGDLVSFLNEPRRSK
uniref:Cytochrome c, class I n=1 Tax=uncultured Acidobacteriota bacterium TaxID=171953 RepID=G8DPK9_9BACT|nr:cytochrome c, class I [uncultured Acidobacteriota bacterium]